MNYYIQGNKEKADKIKAAFEKLGYDISWPGGCANPDVINIGVERNGAKYVVAETFEYIKDIIKTHPDYKELELPVEPKFKVGDMVILNGIVRTITFMDEVYYDFDGGVAGCRIELQDKLKPASNFKKGDLLIHNSIPTCRVLVVDVSEKFGYQLQGSGGKYHLSFTTVENEYHLWSIADAKDGDVLANDAGCIFINAGFEKDDKVTFASYCYVSVQGDFYEEDHCTGSWLYASHVKPATKEQRDLLFAKMKEAGYQWDEKKKELRKIQPHYDIANFKPFDKVLSRDYNHSAWKAGFYSHRTKDNWFACAGSVYVQCIPFEGNEHLLGTTDMCDEQYINW